LKLSRGSSHKYLLDEQGRHCGFPEGDGVTLLITERHLLDIQCQSNSTVHPVQACLQVLSREFTEFQPRPEIEITALLKDRAHRYYVQGPSATFEGFLLQRAWLAAIEDYTVNVLSRRVRFYFETITPYVQPRWFVSYLPDEKELP
jgi:hypothetical protein